MKHKKQKKKFFLIIILIIFLLCAGVFFIIDSGVFSIHQVNVLNNYKYTQEEIIEMSGVVFGTNTFKLKSEDISRRIEFDPYIKQAEVKRNLPDGLTITIEERQDTACIYFLDHWIIIDEEGFVLRTVETNPQLTIVEGLIIEDFTIGEKLKVSNQTFLNDTLSVIIETNKNDLFFKRMKIESDQIIIYITDKLLCKADTQELKENMDILRDIIYDLHSKGIKRGVVRVQGNGYYSYSPVE